MAVRGDARTALPGGTVTLLFADVEGSTRLLHTMGERFAPARARMRRIVRDAAAQSAGYEVDWAGDGVFLAFPRARDAVAAATAMQRALQDEPWAAEEALRLRIGVHTGEPELDDEGYIGMDVVIAARICSAAHGDQIVVSRATRDIVGEESMDETVYRPLGRHRLKDVPTEQQLFQVRAPGLREEFPPLRTLGATSLPALHHRLVGRRDALRRIGDLMKDPEVRLITITGPGGAGKSRLALEVAATAALERPVHLVGLAPIADAELVPNAIARAIGVREAPAREPLEQIAESLTGTGALLFLDNLEHLPHAAVHIAALLDQTPDIDILTTSRTSLRLSSEYVLPLEPLPVDDAATLFVELAAARGVVLHDDALASVHEICRRLDGLPLAIELVAARLVVLPPAEIVRALADGLALEMEGPVDLPERQRTLRAAIDWSYRRLTDRQRTLHSALAVFADGGAIADVRAVAKAGPEFLRDLEALVSWSLVRSEVTDGEVRLSMLETVREHAVDRLAQEDTLDDVRHRHAERFLELALAAASELVGPQQSEWFDRLEVEFDNLSASLNWLLTAGRAEDALRAIAPLERFWRAHGHVNEARRWLALGLDLAEDLPSDVRAAALWTAAQQATAQYDWAAAAPFLEEALTLFRESGKGREVVFALCDLAFVAFTQGDLERAAELSEEALTVARELGDERAISAALGSLADVRSSQGDHEAALIHGEEALRLRRPLGDPMLIADAMYNLGVSAFWAAEYPRARSLCSDALALARELGEAPHIAAAHFLLAELDLLDGDAEAARASIQESLAIYTELDNDPARAGCLLVLGAVAAATDAPEEAARLIGSANALRGEASPDRHQSAILENVWPALEASLGPSRLAELEAEGAGLVVEDLLREVVPAGTEE